jgi:hypothetical protein
MILTISRGAIVPNIRHALKKGLHVPNGGSELTFPGLFYHGSLHNGEGTHLPTRAAENHALNLAGPSDTPIVTRFNLTEENFHFLSGRVHIFREHNGHSYPYSPGTFANLVEHFDDGLVLVNLKDVAPRVLSELGIEVGTLQSERVFRYQHVDQLRRRFEGDEHIHQNFRK